MKCKKCGDEINITVFGAPNDICWGCLQEPEKEVVLDKNIKEIKTTFTIQEIKNYILSQDSLGDVLYNLKAEKIIEANQPMEEFDEDE